MGVGTTLKNTSIRTQSSMIRLKPQPNLSLIGLKILVRKKRKKRKKKKKKEKNKRRNLLPATLLLQLLASFSHWMTMMTAPVMWTLMTFNFTASYHLSFLY